MCVVWCGVVWCGVVWCGACVGSVGWEFGFVDVFLPEIHAIHGVWVVPVNHRDGVESTSV